MKLKQTSFSSSLSYGLLAILGFSTAFLFFLVHQPALLPQKSALIEKEISFESEPQSQGEPPRQSVKSSRYGWGVTLETSSTESVRSVFKEHGFNLDHVRKGHQGVPRIYLSKLPGNWKSQVTKRKKTLFIGMLLPLILEENERIAQMRERIITLFNRRDAGLSISSEDKAWLRQVATEHRLRVVDRSALLARVDVIPPSLALAQAILETGFGSSVAAMRKNSVFGHMATLQRVAAYPSLKASVTSYIQNLNRHEAYKKLRELRVQMRQKGKSISGYYLAQRLEKYSVRGVAYVKEIQGLIKYHSLDEFDKANLRGSTSVQSRS